MLDTPLKFGWDGRKAAINLRKHGVPFTEASTVFQDERAQQFADPDHSEQEERFLMLGISRRLRSLVVSFCYRANDDIIRIISARKADKDGSNLLFQRKSNMRKKYDFTKMRSVPNPFAKRLKKQITIRIGVDTLEYFKRMSEETGIPYQKLIDSYLADCAEKHRKLEMKWG